MPARPAASSPVRRPPRRKPALPRAKPVSPHASPSPVPAAPTPAPRCPLPTPGPTRRPPLRAHAPRSPSGSRTPAVQPQPKRQRGAGASRSRPWAGRGPSCPVGVVSCVPPELGDPEEGPHLATPGEGIAPPPQGWSATPDRTEQVPSSLESSPGGRSLLSNGGGGVTARMGEMASPGVRWGTQPSMGDAGCWPAGRALGAGPGDEAG